MSFGFIGPATIRCFHAIQFFVSFYYDRPVPGKPAHPSTTKSLGLSRSFSAPLSFAIPAPNQSALREKLESRYCSHQTPEQQYLSIRPRKDSLRIPDSVTPYRRNAELPNDHRAAAAPRAQPHKSPASDAQQR